MSPTHHVSGARLSLVCLALTSPWAGAQTAPTAPTAATAATAAGPTPAVVITGNPLGNSPGAAPTSELAGEELVLRRGST